MNEQFNWYKKNQRVHKGIQHLHVSKQNDAGWKHLEY